MSRKRKLVDHGFRLPSAMDNRPLRWEEFLDRIGQTVYLSATPGPYELAQSEGVVEQIIRPDRADRPRGRAQADQGPDRRPAPRDRRAHQGQRARPRHDADQEDGRGPHRLPPRQGGAGPLPAQRGRHPATRRAAARAAAWASTTCSSASTCCARASTCPRCRWSASSTPTRRASCARPVAHPDHRPRGPQRVRPGAHVRRQDHAVDARGHRRDQRRREMQVAYNLEAGVDPQPLRKKIADITDLLNREDADTEALLGSGRSQSRGKATVAAAGAARCRPTPGGGHRPAAQPAGQRPGQPHPGAVRPRCTRRRPTCTSSWRPGCATRSATSRRSCARCPRPRDDTEGPHDVAPDARGGRGPLPGQARGLGRPALGGRLRRQGGRQDLRLHGQRRVGLKCGSPGRGRRVARSTPTTPR